MPVPQKQPDNHPWRQRIIPPKPPKDGDVPTKQKVPPRPKDLH